MGLNRALGPAIALAAWLAAADANAALPRAVVRAFLDEGIPLSAVSVYVREAGGARPLMSHRPGKPMNPASTMKLVTTFAALELLGPDYRWKTEAYAGGPLVGSNISVPQKLPARSKVHDVTVVRPLAHTWAAVKKLSEVFGSTR